MGYGSEAERRSKRLYSLAYGRSLSELKRRHEAEFAGILDRTLKDLLIEEAVTGQEARRLGRGGIRHVEGPVLSGEGEGVVTRGYCAECGGAWPCETARRRHRVRAKKK